jgi:hypothetical protein
VVGIGVADMTSAGEGRDDNQRNTQPVTEEVERLNVPGVMVTTAFGPNALRPWPRLYIPIETVGWG